jgi:four helix bundle protein
MNSSILREKSFLFAVKVVRFCQKLKKVFKEFEISSQLFRSGTAPGALSREAQYAESRADSDANLIHQNLKKQTRVAS